MTIGVDRVQVQKQESTAQGGSDADIGIHAASRPIQPQEDAIESAGGYVQDGLNRDEAVGWHRDGDDLMLFDAATGNAYPGWTLTQILGGGFDVDDILVNADGAVVTNSEGNVLLTG
jgi:hypothetical protein